VSQLKFLSQVCESHQADKEHGHPPQAIQQRTAGTASIIMAGTTNLASGDIPHEYRPQYSVWHLRSNSALCRTAASETRVTGNADQISSKRTVVAAFGWAGLGSPVDGGTPQVILHCLNLLAVLSWQVWNATPESNIEHGPKWQTVWPH